MNKTKGARWSMSPDFLKNLLLINLLYMVRFLTRYLLEKERYSPFFWLIVCTPNPHNDIFLISFFFIWLHPLK